MFPSLVRAGSAPFCRVVSTFSSTRAVLPRVPYAISSGGNLNLPLYAHPSPSHDGSSGPAGGARRGMGFCARAVDVGDEAASSSAASGSDLFAPYLPVRIRCRRHDVEALSEALLCFGASSVTVDDIADAENLDEISIASLYADGEDVDTSVSSAASSAGLHYSPVYETSVGKQCDWVANVQDPEATNIIIDPGLAFGMGEHPITKLCLLFLQEVIKGGERVLDYGTGTGVLGIAALKPSCFPSAINKSEDHHSTNNLDLKFSRGTYDVVAANILLNPLLELVEDIVGYAKPGGIIAVSGILEEQVPKIKEVYSRYLDRILVSEMDGWTCLQGTRRAQRN
ncbi:unnamed protein product [Miscanthus lutarioriparius]|uniref:ETFB lysine methyltransferase n=1 Tax=Miscanthus lutarioriparius TaxID=422564 RepID=A0A811RW72_9POAL|nr:unnamed protein product [Miscanthus lutarioriparius]